ncbi:MAG: vWA domain-containing protein [Vicinamibacterales bacterium]|nr:vWA domain-containing protein [Vicinamibacterales bacterium]
MAAAASVQSIEQRMYVSALDALGAPVADLSAGDVTVREDGLAREVLRVESATDPMQIALLVDNSTAMWRYLGDVRDGLAGFIQRVGEAGEHEIAVVAFGERPVIVADYSTSLVELGRALARIGPRPDGNAPLLDAVYNVSQGLVRREAPRPVVVAVTADSTEYGDRRPPAVLQALADTGATLHGVAVTGAGTVFGGGRRYRDELFAQGTEGVGGQRIELIGGEGFGDVMGALADELLSQYVVTYARPVLLIPPETVEVASARRDLTIRGRIVPARE